MAPALTERQSTVLRLLAEGHTNREIADRLGISENGVKAHVSRLLAKFGVRSRAALVGMSRSPVEASTGVQVMHMMRASLEDILGTSATDILLRRACKHAGVPMQSVLSGQPSLEAVGTVVSSLWPLLVEAAGTVLVNRLRTRGLEPGRVDLEEVASWIDSTRR